MLCLSIYTVNERPFNNEVYSSDNQYTIYNIQDRNLNPPYSAGQCSQFLSEQTTKVNNNLRPNMPDNKNAEKANLTKIENELDNKTASKKNREVGIWLYANFLENTIPTSIIDRLLKFDINTVYFAGTTASEWQNPDKFKVFANFVCYAYSKGLNIYAVTLEDPFFALAKKDEIQAEFVNFIKSTKGLFKTFMVDVEPHVIHLADPLVFVPQYIRMSLILQQVASHYNVTYIDTVPYWYHSVIKNIGISPGIDILGGNEVNFMDYSYSFNQTITNIQRVLPEIEKPYTISIKVTPGYGDPYLNELEFTKTINYLQNNSIPYGVFESQYLLRNMPDLFER
jgi:hypothetical protein